MRAELAINKYQLPTKVFQRKTRMVHEKIPSMQWCFTLLKAKEDWKQGRIVLPPNDNKEFIPLPEDKSKPAEMPKPEPLS